MWFEILASFSIAVSYRVSIRKKICMFYCDMKRKIFSEQNMEQLGLLASFSIAVS